jgi:hypothetical protein
MTSARHPLTALCVEKPGNVHHGPKGLDLQFPPLAAYDCITGKNKSAQLAGAAGGDGLLRLRRKPRRSREVIALKPWPISITLTARKNRTRSSLTIPVNLVG